jgi:ABC-type uncharacterized transport system ATPase subunit
MSQALALMAEDNAIGKMAYSAVNTGVSAAFAIAGLGTSLATGTVFESAKLVENVSLKAGTERLLICLMIYSANKQHRKRKAGNSLLESVPAYRRLFKFVLENSTQQRYRGRCRRK